MKKCINCGKELTKEEKYVCDECIKVMLNEEEKKEKGSTQTIKENTYGTMQNTEEKKGIRQTMKEDTYRTMQNTEDMILTTTNEIKAHNIIEYIGIVSGTDIYLVGGMFGGGLANQEHLFASAMSKATIHLKENAQAMGANAVIGIQSNITSTGGTNNLILTLTGTAVRISAES